MVARAEEAVEHLETLELLASRGQDSWLLGSLAALTARVWRAGSRVSEWLGRAR